VYEKVAMQRLVSELFWALSMGGRDARADEVLGGAMVGLGEAWLRQEQEDLVVVDAGESVEEVARGVWEKVEGRLGQVDKGEVGSVVRRVQ
jgi:dTMP kinase